MKNARMSAVAFPKLVRVPVSVPHKKEVKPANRFAFLPFREPNKEWADYTFGSIHKNKIQEKTCLKLSGFTHFIPMKSGHPTCNLRGGLFHLSRHTMRLISLLNLILSFSF